MSDSRDYIVLNGTKELLDYIDWKANLKTPWTEEEWVQRKPIIREYLQFVHDRAKASVS